MFMHIIKYMYMGLMDKFPLTFAACLKFSRIRCLLGSQKSCTQMYVCTTLE